MRKELSRHGIADLDKEYRKNLVNSLPGLKPVNLIGTIDENQQTNLAIFASVHHIGANPPLMGFIMRPVTAERHTWENIEKNRCFTINSVTESMYKQAHQTSARYPRNVSEFDVAGFTLWHGEKLKAPYVAESPVKIGLELAETHDIKANGTKLIIGQVMEIVIENTLLTQDGTIDFMKAEAVSVGGLDSYYSSNFLGKLPYAKPNR